MSGRVDGACGACRFAYAIPHPGSAPKPQAAPTTFFGKLFDEPQQRSWANSFLRDIHAAKIADHELAIYCHRYPKPLYKNKDDGCGEFQPADAA